MTHRLVIPDQKDDPRARPSDLQKCRNDTPGSVHTRPGSGYSTDRRNEAARAARTNGPGRRVYATVRYARYPGGYIAGYPGGLRSSLLTVLEVPGGLRSSLLTVLLVPGRPQEQSFTSFKVPGRPQEQSFSRF